MKTLKISLLATLLGTLYFSTANAEYTITDLGIYTTPNAINNLGQVVGRSGTGLAFLYSYGNMQPLPGSATDINDSGQIVINSGNSAFVYSNGNLTNLGNLGGGYSRATSINNSGQIVGTSVTSELDCSHIMQGCQNTSAAFLYNNGNMTRISSLYYGLSYANTASAINNNGQIVGTINIPGAWTQEQGWVNSNGITTGLTEVGEINSRTYDINDSGQIVGVSTFERNGYPKATLFSNGNQINLGFNIDFNSSMAINNLGQIVGTAYINDSGMNLPFLLDNGSMLDINSLLDPNQGWTLIDALDINELGQIVGTGTFNGQAHGFLLSPVVVPVPGAVWLFGSGLIGLLGFARRRKIIN